MLFMLSTINPKPTFICISAEFSLYEELHLIKKINVANAKEYKYAVSDASGKHPKNAVLKDTSSVKVDPLKSVSRIHAQTKEVEEGLVEIIAILTDCDWCVRK